MNSGRTKDTTTASLRGNTKQSTGRNTTTPGTVLEVQTEQRASTAEPPKVRQGQVPAAQTAHKWESQGRRGGAVCGGRPKAGHPGCCPQGLQASGRRGPQPAARVRRQPRTYKGSPARPGSAQERGKGLRESSPREARGRGRAGETWSAAGRTRPGSAAWRSLGRGQTAVPARRSARPRPARPWGTRPGRHDWPGRHRLPGRGGGRQGGGSRRSTHVLRVPLIDGGQRRAGGHRAGRGGAAPGAPRGEAAPRPRRSPPAAPAGSRAHTAGRGASCPLRARRHRLARAPGCPSARLAAAGLRAARPPAPPPPPPSCPLR